MADVTAPLTADQLAQMREIPLVGDAAILIDEIDRLAADLAHAQADAASNAINGRAGIRIAEAKWAETGKRLNACKAGLAHARERIASLEAALADYADEDKWSAPLRRDGSFLVVFDGPSGEAPWAKAAAALAAPVAEAGEGRGT